MTLQDFFSQHPRTALGFSGGVDSAFLLHAARSLGADIQPYLVQTPFQPDFEIDDARRLAPDLKILRVDVLALPAVAENPPDRCYFCKKALFGALRQQAEADGYPVLLDGTNASDQVSDRPGMRALEEMGVLSPLRLCGLTKDEIRRRSREAGLFTWNKPAYACLATRVPTGTVITADALSRVEQAEAALRQLGYSDLRVRLLSDGALVQLPLPQLRQADPTAIRQALSHWFDRIFLDTKGR